VSLEISKKEIDECATLLKEFMLYCTATQCFKKAFLSIKGIYYQVEIMGQAVTWIAPYQFNQKLPFDVDYKVMSTFLEFYRALLRFVNFKLFTDLGLKYPPESLAQKDLYLDSVQVAEL
jgi:pescadillo protein